MSNDIMEKCAEPAPVLVRKIGKTTYRVSLHFSTTGTETMDDKIKRLIYNDVCKNKSRKRYEDM